MIRIRGLQRRLGRRQVLDGLDLDIPTGETLVILGRSGTGKSVFLKCENLQRGGAFKIRGAANLVLSIPEADIARGVVAFSSGNVYGYSHVARGGSVETDECFPVGEYAWTGLGRERIYDYHSRRNGTPTLLLRLNYACELRYGVIVVLARKIWTGQPVDLGMSWFNCLWQGDANAHALQSLALATTPPTILNLTGPELLNVRAVAGQLAHHLHRPVTFTGTAGDAALLNNARVALTRFGPPGRNALLEAEIGPHPDARDMARLILGLSPQALAEYAA